MILKNIHPNTIFVNESGLYEILSLSTKPLAKQFMREYLKNIMPQIRKTGKYISDKNNQNKINELNKKLINYIIKIIYC